MGNVIYTSPEGPDLEKIKNKSARDLFQQLTQICKRPQPVAHNDKSPSKKRGKKKKIEEKDPSNKSTLNSPSPTRQEEDVMIPPVDLYKQFISLVPYNQRFLVDFSGAIPQPGEVVAVAQLIREQKCISALIARGIGLTYELMEQCNAKELLATSSSIKMVDFSWNPIGVEGVGLVFAAAKENSRLNTFFFAGVGGRDEVAILVAKYLSERPAQVIDISSNQITPVGWQAVMDTAKKHLHVIDVRMKENEGVRNKHTKELGHLMKRNEAVGEALKKIIDGVFTTVAISRRATQTAEIRRATGALQTDISLSGGGRLDRRNPPEEGRSRGRTIDMALIPRVPATPASEMAEVEQTESKRLAVGFSDTIGKRKEMQDCIIIHGCFRGKEHEDLFGVFDGHGSRNSAYYVAKNFSSTLEKILNGGLEHSPLEALRRTFLQLNDEITPNATHHGTTGAVAYLKGSTLYTSNVGDSRIVLSRGLSAVRLTTDHNTDNPEEIKRIESMQGGYVKNGRVQGALKITRAFGDGFAQPFVSCEPYQRKIHLTKQDKFLIIACDGLFDIFADDVAVEIGRTFIADPKTAAEKLRDQSFLSGSADNISVVVVRLDIPLPESAEDDSSEDERDLLMSSEDISIAEDTSDEESEQKDENGAHSDE